LEGHQAHVAGHAFVPPGQILTWSADKTLRLWNAEDGKLLRTFEGHTDEVACAVLCPDGRHFYSVGFDGTLRYWDLEAPRPRSTVLRDLGRMRCLALSPDGRLGLIAGEGHDHRILLWDVAAGQVPHALAGHTSWVSHAAFAPDGRRIYSAAMDGTLRIWDVAKAAQVKALPHGEEVQSVAVSPDGRFLLSGTRSGVLRLWNAASGEELRRSQPMGFIIDDLTFSADGRFAFVVGGGTGGAPAWNPGTFSLMRGWDVWLWKEVRQLERSWGPTFRVSLSSDGGQALTSHYDHKARLWQLPDPTKSGVARPATAQLILENADPAAPVVLKRAGKVVAGPTADKILELEPGVYEIAWAEPQPYLRFSPDNFELTPGSPTIIQISQVRPTWPEPDLTGGRILAPDLRGIKPLLDENFHDPRGAFPKDKLDRPPLQINVGVMRPNDGYTIHLRSSLRRWWEWYVKVPSEPLPALACEVTGRVHEFRDTPWFLRVSDKELKRGIDIDVGNKGTLAIGPARFNEQPQPAPLVGPITSAALKRGNEFNSVLIVLRGRLLEVYVNNVAVCNPILLDRDFPHENLLVFFGTHGQGTELRAEFQRVRLWPAAGLPTPQERRAVLR
jgi:hypothetical protein